MGGGRGGCCVKLEGAIFHFSLNTLVRDTNDLGRAQNCVDIFKLSCLISARLKLNEKPSTGWKFEKVIEQAFFMAFQQTYECKFVFIIVIINLYDY